MVLIRRVSGDSMSPAYKSGSVVVAKGSAASANVGDVVIVRHGGLEKIKRVQQIKNGRVFLVGDNHESSTDSRNFGWISLDSIVAKVIWPRR